MANRSLFASKRGATPPAADTVNKAGGLAHQLPSKHALAQLAATGCLGDTFYADAESQLTDVLGYLNSEEVTPEFAGKVAVFRAAENVRSRALEVACDFREHAKKPTASSTATEKKQKCRMFVSRK